MATELYCCLFSNKNSSACLLVVFVAVVDQCLFRHVAGVCYRMVMSYVL